jgi:hypothetical protein
MIINDNFPAGSAHRPGINVFQKKVIIIHTMCQIAAINEAMAYFKSRGEQGIFNYCIGTNGEIHEMIPEGEVAWHLGGVVKYPELIDFFGFGEHYRTEIFNKQMVIEFQRYKTRFNPANATVIKPAWNMNWYSVGIGICTENKMYHNTDFSEDALAALDECLPILKESGWEYVATRRQLHDWKATPETVASVHDAVLMPDLPANLKELANRHGLKTIKN